jgi:hypothetical protein
MGRKRPEVPDEESTYVTTPTHWTVFLRTFLPWQVWRFLRINLKMLGMVRRHH